MAKTETVYPVYMIAGFLDSGKTSFINGILSDGFALEDRTLLICCEEGEVEYDPKVMHNVTVVTVEDQETLTPKFLLEQQKKCKATQIIVEYNGMWDIQPFYEEGMPENWVLYQIIFTVDGPTFDIYSKNMGPLMLEKLRNADMIIINRCSDELCTALRRRNLRLINRRADIYLEKDDGTSEDYMDGTVSAFDLSGPELRIADEDYGLWYVEIMDNPAMYEGKTVIFRAMMCKPPQYGDYFTPGRFVMVCCEKDMNFLALACIGWDVSKIPEKTWVEVTARVSLEHWDPYGEEDGPVLHVTDLRKCEKPAEEVVQMTGPDAAMMVQPAAGSIPLPAFSSRFGGVPAGEAVRRRTAWYRSSPSCGDAKRGKGETSHDQAAEKRPGLCPGTSGGKGYPDCGGKDLPHG